jgi:hypothetical protein
VDVNYCDVRGGQTGIYNSGAGTVNWGPGNIEEDPLFVSPGYWGDVNDITTPREPDHPNAVWVDGDYHLLPTSPCIDRGDNGNLPPDEIDLDGDGDMLELLPWDLDNNPRIMDGDVDGTPDVDMGAYESFLPVPMKFTPQKLNCKSNGRWVKAHFVLPDIFVIDDVNTAELVKIIQPFEIEAHHMNVFINLDGLVEIEAAFDRSDFCALVDLGDVKVEAIGRLWDQINGDQVFYGTDTIVCFRKPENTVWPATSCTRKMTR